MQRRSSWGFLFAHRFLGWAVFWFASWFAPHTGAAPAHYVTAYDGALVGSWVKSCWESTPLTIDWSATAPGRTGTAIEVTFGSGNGWDAFGLADRKPGWDNQYKYLNEFRTVEFDLYFEPGSADAESLIFILEDAGYAATPRLVDLIAGWSGMSPAQRYGTWHHVAVDLATLQPQIARFAQFLFFNNSGSAQPHFRLMNVRLGWDDDTTPPSVTLGAATLNATYDQLTLQFSSSEPARYYVEYGTTAYDQTLAGPADTWATSHTATLTGLTPGTTYRYRIVALDHRTDPTATPNAGTYTGTYAVPATPTTAPSLSGLTAGDLAGNRATLTWSTNRPCTASIAYHKAGQTALTRTFADLQSSRACVLDLLEPNTAYSATVQVTDAFNLSTSQTVAFTTGAAGTPSVTITVQPAASHPISPWIYGINFYADIPAAPRNLTLNRQGGNRWTAYNWENNASNAGSDWYYSNDGYLGASNTPAETVRSIIAADRARGTASLITVQLQGYVAADKNGSVDLHDPNHLATRFKQVVFKKPTAFTTTPATSDAYVYMDEFLWTLRQKLGADLYSDPTTPTLINLDNEPELWPSTHAEIQSGPPPVADYLQRTVALCSAIKDLAPSAITVGPAHYGFNGIVNWQNAEGFSDTYWFTDRYLADLKAASLTYGRRLLDAYDIHWYSEAQADGTRITNLTGTTLNETQIQAIVQSPRSLWDTTYREDSWVADYCAGPVYILKRLQDKIDAIWPGTGLAIGEYNNGGANHIAGTIAQADNLGIFGQMGVYLATFWPTSDSPFILAAYKMYRDYDGQLATFGDVSLPTTSSDTAKVAAYVSRDTAHAGRHVIVALNRSNSAQDVAFAGLALTGTARVYRLAGTQTSPSLAGEVPVNLSNWVITLPALSVSTIELNTPATEALTILTQPTATSVVAGHDADFHLAAHSALAITYRWQRLPAGATLWSDLAEGSAYAGTATDTLTVRQPAASQTGDQFRCRVHDGTSPDVTSTAATLTVQWSQFSAISARAPVGTGDQTLFLGFVFAGGGKPTLIRGVGPGLLKGDASLVGQILADPELTLRELQTVDGVNQLVPIAANDNWGGTTALRTAMHALGMGALDDTSSDAVLLCTPTHTVYTAQVSGVAGTTGLALAEAYDAAATDQTRRMTALSVRNQVGTGANLLIAGFVITGDAPKRVLLRGVGPGLVPAVSAAQVLPNPTLQLHQYNPDTLAWTLVGANDDWGGSAELAAAMSAAGMGPLGADSHDAVLLRELPPGIYTAQVSGVDGTTGIALVEIYEAR